MYQWTVWSGAGPDMRLPQPISGHVGDAGGPVTAIGLYPTYPQYGDGNPKWAENSPSPLIEKDPYAANTHQV